VHAICFPGDAPEEAAEEAAGDGVETGDGGDRDRNEDVGVAGAGDRDRAGDGALLRLRAGETDAAFWDRVTACHDGDDVLWFLLFRSEDFGAFGDFGDGDFGDAGARSGTMRSDQVPPSLSQEALRPNDGGGVGVSVSGDDLSLASRRQLSAVQPTSGRQRELVGFAAAVPYATSVYGLHLAVVPSHRGLGHGAWLMHEVQAWALSEGHTKVQASVSAAHVRLLRYYQHLGARVVATGMGSAGSAPPTVLRIVRDFDAQLALGELESSRHRASEASRYSSRLIRTMTRGVSVSMVSLSSMVSWYRGHLVSFALVKTWGSNPAGFQIEWRRRQVTTAAVTVLAVAAVFAASRQRAIYIDRYLCRYLESLYTLPFNLYPKS
jgi:GNAT superfamily N-acetyltransferase